MIWKIISISKMYLTLTLTIFGFFVTTVHSQQLTTKCLNSDWTQYYEKCYLAVNYTLSWPSANGYCEKYGAKLVEPRGYDLNDAIHGEVASRMPTVASYWTGYYRPVSISRGLPAYSAYWSDGESVGVEAGVWGLNQPDISAGNCAFVNNADKFWYMESCDMLMPFLCEMDPCSAGDRDTYMCNGNCIGPSLKCDGKNDCGNNMDEQDCAIYGSWLLEGSLGTITPETSGGLYLPNANNTWLIHTAPGTRVNAEVTYLNTEYNTDFLEFYDAGFSTSQSSLSARLSGDMANYRYRSSLNLMLLRFVSDSSMQDVGFEVTWSTEYPCQYTQLMNYRYSNTDIQLGEPLRLTSLQNYVKCQTECDEQSDCIGFSYDSTSKTCYFMSMLPILVEDSTFSIYSKTCPGYGTVKGSVPYWNTMQTATGSYQQLATPLYPGYYIANTELEYQITASANNRITLEVLTVDLCCGDTVTILDKQRTLLYTLNSDSVPVTWVSTSNSLYVRMNLNTHWKCKGVLMRFKEGCDVSMQDSGQFISQGYGSVGGYGSGLSKCSWTIHAPSPDRSVTVVYDAFNLDSSDTVTITNFDGTESSHTERSLQGMSNTSISSLKVTFETSARDSGVGFSASFSPGCTSLNTEGYNIISGGSNYNDVIGLGCAEGYYFTGPNAGETSIQMTCGLGGIWSLDPVPVCARSHCGPPPLIEYADIIISSGSQGSDITEYRCKEGTSLTGSEIITCLADGSWEAPPVCTSLPCNDLATTLPTMNAEVLYGSGTGYDSVARLSCPMYSEVIGAANVSCQDGHWDFTTNPEPSSCRAIPCETPLIDNALLAQSPPYRLNMSLAVSCMPGYELNGVSTFRCGVDTELPTCVRRTCSIADIPNVQSVSSPDQTIYDYGKNVEVECVPNQTFLNVGSSSIQIECLDNRQWSFVPLCGNASCYEPYQVTGSVYSAPCLDYGCSFQFACESSYELVGSSAFIADPSQTQGDTFVRCGAVHDGLWDFGDLRCIGAQCGDPGYPASGFLNGLSFEKGSLITYGCSVSGYEPLLSDNITVSTGRRCIHDTVTDTLIWDGEMPTCMDTQSPVFSNCPTETIEIGMLEAPGFERPTALDNNALQSFVTFPDNFDPLAPEAKNRVAFYIATDYNGNSAECRVTIEIPNAIVCHNSASIGYEIAEDGTIAVNNAPFFEQKNAAADLSVTFEPEFINVTAEAATLENIYEVEVTATNSTTNEEVDRCTIQFRLKAPDCATWSLYVPNGVGNCANGVCNPTCNEGYYFMEDPLADTIQVVCTDEGWDRDPPVCAKSTTNYVIYTAKYNYKYFLHTSISELDVCRADYREEIEDRLDTFANEMQAVCNSDNTVNPVSVTLINMDPLEYEISSRRLFVKFEFEITVTNEEADGTFDLKEGCANSILVLLKDALESNYAISTLDGTTDCSGGVFDYISTSPSFNYRCIGNRKFANVNGNRYCLNCPIGHYYNEASGNGGNCDRCPVNTYGDPSGETASVGPTCLSCPNGAGPDKTGLTNLDSCYFKAKCQAGYFSTDGLAPCSICPRNFYSAGELSMTCQQCDEYKITLNAGSTSHLACLTQQEAENNNDHQGTTPCAPNPCLNGATCTYIRNTYACACPPELTGRLCDVAYTACSSNPCENGQQCQLTTGGGYTCNCGITGSSEFTGDRCQIDHLGCSPSFCLNNGTCHNARGSHTCKCTSYGGYSNLGTGSCNTPIDQCTENPCDQGARVCVPHGSFYRSCDCNPGYTDLDCSTNIDDCATDLCRNGATCVDGIDGFSCQCAEDYHGHLCQFVKSCDQTCTANSNIGFGCNTCDLDGTETCEDIGNSFSCNCKAGFTGTSCEVEISLCNSYPCKHDGTCVELADTEYICLCWEPWTGDNCETEIDNCEMGTECENGGTCYSSASRHICSCANGYIGSTCADEYDLCSRANPCTSPGSVCSYDDGSFTCTCEDGYTGDSCQTLLPSCDDTVCNNGGTCIDVEGTLTCNCPDGYSGDFCEININECLSNPCADGQECQDGVNSYTCTCGTSRRGENCDKPVDVNFDYIISPTTKCRLEASQSSFGDGVTELEAFTVSFWVRYTTLHGRGDILSIFATNDDVPNIPTIPRFTIRFDSTQMVAEYSNPTSRRRKRQTDNLVDFNYPSLADGYWWHVAVTWASSGGEITLYINGTLTDQEFFATGNTLGTRGFVVLGNFDALGGSSDVTNSFEGRISQLFVVNESLSTASIQQLKNRNLNPANQILYPQRTLMLQYPIDYSSELHPAVERCILRTDTSCDINAAISLPRVTTCPGDVWVITDRETAPTWTTPTFFGLFSPISTISSGTQLDWGVYGVSYAVFDTDNNAALCTFRVYNRESSCTQGGGDATCVAINGMYRCESSCTTSQGWPGVVPLYLTCSIYGMYDQAARSTDYIKPKCSDISPVTNDVTLELTGTTSVQCLSIREEYRTNVLNELNNFNTQTGNSLCSQTCFPIVTSDSVTCLDVSTIRVSINFGLISPTLTWQSSSVSVDEALQIAVGDSQVFAYASTSDNSRTVDVDVASVDVTSSPTCQSQSQVSGDSCVVCGAGTSYNAVTSTCVRCEKGKYRDTILATCTACPTGQTTASDGATSSIYCAENCFRGRYFDSQDLQSCRDCPIGFYQDSLGEFSCKPCPVLYTTVAVGSQFANSCVTTASLTTTTPAVPPPGANLGASTADDSGLDTGVIVAIVLGVLIGLLIIILILVFCCCKGAVPCFSKKKQVVSPVGKEGYYANKYGELDMRFVSYNLKDVREKKGRPLDREPIYEPPLSDDTGSLKTDISIHVPVFNEKMNGSVTKKSLYMSNGGQHMNNSFTRSLKSSARDPASSRDPATPHIIAPMTSSPRSMNYNHYENVEEMEPYRKPRSKRRKRKGHKHRSSGHHEREDFTYEGDLDVNHQPLPKALSPLPMKVKSKPPSDVFMRPSSPMNRPRTEVLPSQYEDFLGHSPVRSLERSRGDRSMERSRGERSRDERSLDRSRGERSMERSRGERSMEMSRDERSRSHHSQRSSRVHHVEDSSVPEGTMMRIEVESDGEDLR